MPENPVFDQPDEPSSQGLPKTFDPGAFEARWYELWEREGRFQPAGAAGSPRFVMVIPPPNVTGRLHIGHAYGRTIEDILARWKRMLGFRVLWLPGTDHAGIATQMVVERELERRGLDRRSLGRERFLERVWEWRRQSGDTILGQLRRLGCSLDWSRLRFTMDPALSRAVRRAFVLLYRDGLIYKGRYVVNWCPGCGTAVSDLEVIEKKTPGVLYQIRYDVPGVAGGAVVATTRPETMLGDTALAIHPEDPRNAGLRGKKAILPIVGRELPVVEDAILVDREFGTGIVKVTPAHDANDFAVGQRHALPAIVVIGPDGKMTEAAGEFAGLDRFEARKRIVERLAAEGRIVAADAHEIALGTCQRSDDVIEPYLSEQWFVKVQPLAEPAIRAVRDGAVRFVPESWTKTYFAWMENIRDWCISRQLWWGHRIPAFTCENGHVLVEDEDPVACGQCGSRSLSQDPDVLDTWFSSQLWPFSVFGWPEKTEDLEEFYPTDVLVTGYDILFFWVARMIMAGLRFTGQAPFSTVHLHGLVRVGGEKMSKTRGNVIDPLEAIQEFGADAVRFTLASAASSGPTVSVERGRMAGSRNFATKIWSAARFTLAQLEGKETAATPRGLALSLTDRWILSRLTAVCDAVHRHLEDFRFDEAAGAIYAFVWHELCDGYVEMVKSVFAGPDVEAAGSARAVLRKCLEDSLALLHPFMPFVTEELWDKLTGRPGTLIVTAYPRGDAAWRDEAGGVGGGDARDRHARPQPPQGTQLCADGPRDADDRPGLARALGDPGPRDARAAAAPPGPALGAALRVARARRVSGRGRRHPAGNGAAAGRRGGFGTTRRKGALRRRGRDRAALGQARQRRVPRQGSGRRRREDPPAPARAREQAGRAESAVIGFGEGFIDPNSWTAIENCISIHRTPSSNLLARGLIEMYFEEGQELRPTVLIAESQPGAYGRNGRAWAAPEGKGLYLTIVRRVAAGEPLSLAPIALARWSAEVLREETGIAVELKWPNDLYARRRKLAGVIAESRTQGADTYLAAGMGINVRGRAEALAAPNATTVEEEAGRAFPLAPLLQALLDRFDRELAAPKWEREASAWELASLHRPGDRMTIRRNGEDLTGEYLGLDPSGFLRLRTEKGEAVVATGEVSQW